MGPLTTREIVAIETARGTRHVVLVTAGARHVDILKTFVLETLSVSFTTSTVNVIDIVTTV
jgi:hypothetical protein